jgi:YesN/AraC family two-component response regulator
MSSPVTKQELQSTIENAKSRILERQVSKQDIQSAVDVVRQQMSQKLMDLHVENQQIMRQSAMQVDQLIRLIQDLRNRISSLEQTTRQHQQMMQVTHQNLVGQVQQQQQGLRPAKQPWYSA